jgi:hypothetical protein
MKFLHSKGDLIAMSVQKSDDAPRYTFFSTTQEASLLCQYRSLMMPLIILDCTLLFWSFALSLSGIQERKTRHCNAEQAKATNQT